MVGQGRPAVSRRSKSSSGVVMTLIMSAQPFSSKTGSRDTPVDISNVEDFTKIARHLGVAAHELGFDASLPQIGAHGEIRNGSDHGDGGRDVVEDTMRTRLGV